MNFIKFFFLFIILSIHAADEKIDDATVPAALFPLILKTLNPAKGVTVWKAPETTENIKWIPYGDLCRSKTAAITLDGEWEITVSPFTWHNDNATLISTLYRHMLNNMDPSCHGEISFKVPGFCKGDIQGDTVTIENLSSHNLETMLPSFENEVRRMGGRRLYVTVSNGKKGLLPLIPADPENTKIYDLLQTQGYADTSSYLNFKTGTYDTLLMKEIGCEDSGLTCGVVADLDTDYSVQALSECFGIFVRDSAGTVLGGLLGTLEKKAVFPHVDGRAFVMDESIRGTGLGKIIMTHAGRYVKNQGIGLVTLGTDDSLATWFYEKYGFRRVHTISGNLKLRSGERASSHIYTISF